MKYHTVFPALSPEMAAKILAFYVFDLFQKTHLLKKQELKLEI